MKKYFKIGTALAFLFAVNFAPTLTTNVYATESTDNTNIVETPLATEQYNATDVVYDYSNVEVEEPLEVREPAHVESTAEANNVAPARAPTAAPADNALYTTREATDSEPAQIIINVIDSLGGSKTIVQKTSGSNKKYKITEVLPTKLTTNFRTLNKIDGVYYYFDGYYDEQGNKITVDGIDLGEGLLKFIPAGDETNPAANSRPNGLNLVTNKLSVVTEVNIYARWTPEEEPTFFNVHVIEDTLRDLEGTETYLHNKFPIGGAGRTTITVSQALDNTKYTLDNSYIPSDDETGKYIRVAVNRNFASSPVHYYFMGWKDSAGNIIRNEGYVLPEYESKFIDHFEVRDMNDGDNAHRQTLYIYFKSKKDIEAAGLSTDQIDLYVHTFWEGFTEAILTVNYIDNISTGDGSWSNPTGGAIEYNHTFSNPENKTPVYDYDFLYWKFEDANDDQVNPNKEYMDGDKFYYDLFYKMSEWRGNITAYAWWQPYLTLKLYDDMNGNELDSQTAPHDLYVYGGSLKSEPKREGYVFLGWYDENGNKIDPDVAIKAPAASKGSREDGNVPKTIRLYARWARATQDITISKEWSDTEERNHRTDSVTVYLYQEGNDTPIGDSIVLSEDNSWTATVNGVFTHDIDGNKINYYVTEDKVPSYNYDYEISETENGLKYTITNSIKEDGEVIVKYIDVDSGLEIADKTDYFDSIDQTYTATPKTVDGYDLVQRPENETVTITDTPQTLVYYYQLKKGNVVIYYIDNDTKENIIDPLEYEGRPSEPYTSEQIEFPGYEYRFMLGDANGNFESNKTINVYYVYEKVGKVIAKYVDIDTGDVLFTAEPKTGSMGEEYTTEELSFDNYELVRVDGNANGRYNDEEPWPEDVVVTYYYQLKTGKVTVYYVDKETGEEIESDEFYEKVGTDYNITPKPIDYYDAVEPLPSNAEGKYTADDIEIYFYYQKQSGTVTAYYIDSVTKEVITEKTTPGYVPETYKTAPIDIDGYRYINIVVGEESGQFVKDENIKVYYYYEPVGKVIVKYLEDGTNNVLLEEQVLVDSIGSEYTTYDYYKENINNYNWLRTEGNERGRYTKDDQVVIYYYKIPAVTGELVVNYIDQDNNLLDSWSDTQEVGTEYTTEAKEIAGYTPKFVIGAPTGTYSIGTTTVTYVYAKNPEVVYGTLKVNYIDTNNNLLDSWSDTQEVGTEYTTEQKSFAGYTPKFVLGNPSGTYSTGTTTVTYVYEKIPATLSGEVVVKYIENTGRKLVDEDIVITGDYGTTYTTEQKSFDGYNFVAVYGPTQGTIDQPKTTVIYMYEKVKSDETGSGSCNNNCGCNCCSSCNNTCNNSCDNGEQEPTQPVINIDITINNDNSTDVNNENNNQDENNVNNENNPVNNTDVNVETGDNNINNTNEQGDVEVTTGDNVNNNSNNSESNAEGGNATNGDTNVNVETGDNNTNVENNANLVSGDTNIENNPAINIENNPENNNDVNVENNTNVENNPVNTVETGDNTITTGDTNVETGNNNVTTGDTNIENNPTVENNTNVETGDVNNSSEAITGNVENNTTVETGDVTNTNTVEGGNNSNDNTVEIKDNTLNNEANGGNSSNNNTNEGNTTTVETGDNTNGGNTNNNNNENNNENNNNTCTDCNDQQGGSEDGGNSQSSDTPKTGEVVAHYVDIYGNMIGVDMPYEGQVGERYNTILRSFRGYRLTQVVGARSGQFEDGMIDVTYIYEKLPTGSTSGYDIPENDYYNYATNPSSSKYSRVTIPNTSVSSNNNLIVLLINLVMIISLGLYKKFAN